MFNVIVLCQEASDHDDAQFLIATPSNGVKKSWEFMLFIFFFHCVSGGGGQDEYQIDQITIDLFKE